MISSELEQAIAVARSTLPLDQEWSMMNSIPERSSPGSTLEAAPGSYLELLRLVDGGIFGSVVVFGTNTVGKMQFYAEDDEGAPVRLGRELWFCFGKVNEDPLFVNRQDGTVWGFPDQGVVWQDSDVFEKLADSVGEFVERFALGSEYRTLSGVDEDDQWWRLLMHIGRV